jgi:hypothetical protein
LWVPSANCCSIVNTSTLPAGSATSVATS